MQVLMATSEAVPFAKTGGLADVCGALPAALQRLGHCCTLILPCFRPCRQAGLPIEGTGVHLNLPVGNRMVAGSLLRSRLPNSDVTVYLVEQDDYFDRPGLYGEGGKDYADNCERFVFFSRAVIEAIRLLNLRTDILHLNDWQTALAAAYLKLEYRGTPGYENLATLYTIHNLAYQGRFWHWDMVLTGLDWKYFNWRQMEFYGDLNLMKTGLVFADWLSTVSPRYAEEIQTAEQGCGLEGVIQQRRHELSGIINGVDYEEWDPATDRNLPVPYCQETVAEGKAACKAALQRELGLPLRPEVPLIGIVGRLVDQKGWNLIGPLMQQWAESRDVQWAVLGTGDPKYHDLLNLLARRAPDRVKARLEFSGPLAHRVEAGADLFLMPSLYEPCGLNQLYSLKYGTVPVVRATGGLADTITDANPQTLAEGVANGFRFDEYTVEALERALDRACRAFADRPLWHRLVETGMHQDWSWNFSARQYADLYQHLLVRTRQAVYS